MSLSNVSKLSSFLNLEYEVTLLCQRSFLMFPLHEVLCILISQLLALIDLLPPSGKDLRKNWKTENDIMENLKSAITFNNSNGVEVCTAILYSCKYDSILYIIYEDTFWSPIALM